ncbi:MAG: acyltransferase [Aquabacterium sp.]|nr:acyltransferase [Aquabacterium sp.]
MYVMLHHAVLNIDSSGIADATWSFLHVAFGHGQFRVDIFFVLSGYCLTLALRGATHIVSFKLFILRRSIRLLIPYFAGCAMSLLLIQLCLGERTGTHWDFSLPVTEGSVITHLLLIHNLWPQYAVTLNHAYWSIGVEYQLYLLFPLLLWVQHRLGPWKSMAVITAFAYSLWQLSHKLHVGNASDFGASPYYWALFSMGMSAARLGPRGPGSTQEMSLTDKLAVSLMALTMGLWWAVECMRYHGHVADPIFSFFVGVFTLLVLLYGRQIGLFALVSRIWPRPLLRWIGARSFSLYLVHAPLLQLAWLWLVQPLHLQSAGDQVLVEMLTGGTLSLLVASLFYRFIEQPSHEWSRRLTSP